MCHSDNAVSSEESQSLKPVAFDDFDLERDFGAPGEHDRRRAVFFFRQLDRAFDLLAIEPVSRDAILEMNARKYLGLDGNAVGLCFDDTVRYPLARFFQYLYDIERRACSGAGEHELHRAGAEISPAGIRGAVDDDGMTAARFGNEARLLDPFDTSLHRAATGVIVVES